MKLPKRWKILRRFTEEFSHEQTRKRHEIGENMSKELIAVFFIGSFFVICSPIYWQRRRISRMADEDLKKLDYEEWKRQAKSNVYIKMFSRIIWGLVILSGFIFNFQKVAALGFNWLSVFVLVLGLSFIVWGILGFRRELKQVQNLK